jgi:hypothetical protein
VALFNLELADTGCKTAPSPGILLGAQWFTRVCARMRRRYAKMNTGEMLLHVVFAGLRVTPNVGYGCGLERLMPRLTTRLCLDWRG